MSEFLYKVDILSQNRSALFKELNNRLYKNFIKVIVNDDKDVLTMFVDDVISELCDDVDVHDLTCVDKLYIMLILRTYNVGPSITFVCETDEEDEQKKAIKINCNLDIIKILQQLEQLEITHRFEISNDNIQVFGSLPKRFFYETSDELISDCVDSIIFNNKEVSLLHLDLDQKIEIVNSLPSFVLPEIYKYIATQDDILKETPLVVINTDKNIKTNKDIFISIANGSIPEIIKLFFRVSLKDFYVNEYNLIKKFKFNYTHLQEITPAELNLYIDVIKEDMDREKKEQEKQEQSSNQERLPPPVQSGRGTT